MCRWLYVCLSLWDQAHSVLWLVIIEKSHLWMLHLVYLNFLYWKFIEKLLIHLFLHSILLSFRSCMYSSSFDWPTVCTIADYLPYRTWYIVMLQCCEYPVWFDHSNFTSANDVTILACPLANGIIEWKGIHRQLLDQCPRICPIFICEVIWETVHNVGRI